MHSSMTHDAMPILVTGATGRHGGTGAHVVQRAELAYERMVEAWREKPRKTAAG